MKICPACYKKHRDNDWYIGPFDSKSTDGCDVHPTTDNWRVVRTLKTLKVWSLEGAGYSVMLTPTCKMPVSVGAGHVHEKTAKAKMFDYETPFVDLLVEQGYVARHPGTPTTITVTAKGDEFLRQCQLEAEAKGGVGKTADFKK